MTRGLFAHRPRARARAAPHRRDVPPGRSAPDGARPRARRERPRARRRRAFRASGLSHLLAVSGMHLVLVLALAVRALEGAPRAGRGARGAGRRRARRRGASAMPVAWVYAELAGAGGSTLRAAWMVTAALAARALGRRTDATRAPSGSRSSRWRSPIRSWPSTCRSSSPRARPRGSSSSRGRSRRQLEARGPAARVAPVRRARGGDDARRVRPVRADPRALRADGAARRRRREPRRRPPRRVRRAPALPRARAARRGGRRPSAGARSWRRGRSSSCGPIARGFAAPALTAEVPPPTSWQLAVLAVGARGGRCCGARGAARAWRVCAAAVAAARGRRRGARARRTGVLRATFLDVGQGDARHRRSARRGGDPHRRRRPRREPDRHRRARPRARAARAAADGASPLAVLTHPHPDHFGGLATGLDAVRVGALWDTGQGEARAASAAATRALLAADARARRPGRAARGALRRARAGRRARRGARAVPGLLVRTAAPNDNSFVLRISLRRARAPASSATPSTRRRRTLLATGARSASAPTCSRSATTGAARRRRPRSSRRSRRARRSSRSGAATASATRTRSRSRTLAAAGARVWRTDRDGAVDRDDRRPQRSRCGRSPTLAVDGPGRRL